MNTPKKPHPALLKASLCADHVFAPPVPIVKPKVIYNADLVCAYIAAVLTDSLVLTEEKPPVVLQGRVK